MSKMQRALISLTDKSGIEEFAGQLQDIGIEILSTGGTAKKMRENGIAVKGKWYCREGCCRIHRVSRDA